MDPKTHWEEVKIELCHHLGISSHETKSSFAVRKFLLEKNVFSNSEVERKVPFGDQEFLINSAINNVFPKKGVMYSFMPQNNIQISGSKLIKIVQEVSKLVFFEFFERDWPKIVLNRIDPQKFTYRIEKMATEAKNVKDIPQITGVQLAYDIAENPIHTTPSSSLASIFSDLLALEGNHQQMHRRNEIENRRLTEELSRHKKDLTEVIDRLAGAVTECNSIRTNSKNQIWILEKDIEELRQSYGELKKENKIKRQKINDLEQERKVYTRLFQLGEQAEQEMSQTDSTTSTLTFESELRAPSERTLTPGSGTDCETD